MIKVWIHKPGGQAPFLMTEMTADECATQFDLGTAKYLRPLDPSQPLAPPPLATDTDPELVVFEVLADEEGGTYKPGYYASEMTADAVQVLIGEE
ncbi:MAG: hypothetical protein RIM84_11580 [Alphaproteobacteria bacterium]